MLDNPEYCENISYAPFKVRINGLSADRGGRRIFEGLGFDIINDSLIALVGTNGSGKSTLLRTLAGLIRTYKEDAIDATGDYFDNLTFAHSFIYLGHEKGLKLGLTLKENCDFWYQSMTGSNLDDAMYQKCLSQLSIAHLSHQRIKYFSSGQRQRSALLRFLLLPKPIWLMDEPTVGLDSDSKQILNDMIHRHRQRGGAAIIATHDMLENPSQELSLDDFKPAIKNESFWADG